MKRLRIGTRGSPLALRQAKIVQKRLSKAGNSDSELVIIKTTGDKNLSSSILESGGKGIFIKEIETRLLAEDVDIAVHSLKDMAAVQPDGLTVGAYLQAEDSRDVLVSRNKFNLKDLETGSSVGTGSPRRTAQLKLLREDLEILPIRGNVGTRIRKVRDGEYDAVVLAAAGIMRLGLTSEIDEYLSYDQMIPAPGQGVIAVESREGDKEIREILKSIDNPDQRTISTVEFGILANLGATCTTPIGIRSELKGNQMTTTVFISDPNYSSHIKKQFIPGCFCRSAARRSIWKG